jgi:hypothetical protein
MKAALVEFLNLLDEIAETHSELWDTDVTEALADTLNNAFIDPIAGYVVPSRSGCFLQRRIARAVRHHEVPFVVEIGT